VDGLLPIWLRSWCRKPGGSAAKQFSLSERAVAPAGPQFCGGDRRPPIGTQTVGANPAEDRQNGELELVPPTAQPAGRMPSSRANEQQQPAQPNRFEALLSSPGQASSRKQGARSPARNTRARSGLPAATSAPALNRKRAGMDPEALTADHHGESAWWRAQAAQPAQAAGRWIRQVVAAAEGALAPIRQPITPSQGLFQHSGDQPPALRAGLRRHSGSSRPSGDRQHTSASHRARGLKRRAEASSDAGASPEAATSAKTIAALSRALLQAHAP